MAHPLKMCSMPLAVRWGGNEAGREVEGKPQPQYCLGQGSSTSHHIRGRNPCQTLYVEKRHWKWWEPPDCGGWASSHRGIVSQLSLLFVKIFGIPVIETHKFWRCQWHVGTCIYICV